MQTFTGRRFDLIYPQARDVCAADLAHHLGYQGRYAGAARQHWATAQHSIIVAAAVWARTHDKTATAHGLLHDAHEAYTGDQIHPLKIALAEVCAAGRDALREIARGCDHAIWQWAGIAPPDIATAKLIKDLDQGAVLALERSLQLGPAPAPWINDELKVRPLSPEDLDTTVGGEIWSALTRSWPNDVAESAFFWAMRHTLPVEISGMTIETTPYLVAALKRCLPAAGARA